MRNFREYDIWKIALEIAKSIYVITKTFPPHEKFGLSAQLQRAAVSISSNIAEGAARSSEKEFTRFLEIGLGSAFEVETQLIIAQEIGYISEHDFSQIMEPVHSLQKQLHGLLESMPRKKF